MLNFQQEKCQIFLKSHFSIYCFLATYAAAVLFRMSEDKGGEYTKRLSQELRSSLYQRGQEESLWGNEHMPPADLQVGAPPPPYIHIPPLSLKQPPLNLIPHIPAFFLSTQRFLFYEILITWLSCVKKKWNYCGHLVYQNISEGMAYLKLDGGNVQF